MTAIPSEKEVQGFHEVRSKVRGFYGTDVKMDDKSTTSYDTS
jgi:hypothetical protein